MEIRTNVLGFEIQTNSTVDSNPNRRIKLIEGNKNRVGRAMEEKNV